MRNIMLNSLSSTSGRVASGFFALDHSTFQFEINITTLPCFSLALPFLHRFAFVHRIDRTFTMAA